MNSNILTMIALNNSHQLQGVDSKLRERAFKILDRFGAKNVANPGEEEGGLGFHECGN